MHSRGAPRNCETPTLKNLPGEQRQTPPRHTPPVPPLPVHLSHCSALRRRRNGKKKKDFSSYKYTGSASRRVGCSRLKMQHSQVSRSSCFDTECSCFVVCWLVSSGAAFVPLTGNIYMCLKYVCLVTLKLSAHGTPPMHFGYAGENRGWCRQWTCHSKKTLLGFLGW